MVRYSATGTWVFAPMTRNRRLVNAAVRGVYGIDHRQARRLMRRCRLLPDLDTQETR